jgi:ABC-type Fe3+ transport system permease subunit
VFLPLLAPALAGVWIWTVLHVVRSPGKPLILSDGPDSEVLAVTIWNMWDQGYVEMAGAVGAMTILALFVVAIAAQWLASRRRAPLD